MSMEVSSNYGNYYNSTLPVSQKENNQTAEVSKNTSQSNKDKVQEYYESLCKKFSGRLTFNTSKGLATSSENNIVVNLSYDCLKKMANNPEFAKKIENDIAGIPTAHKGMYAKAKSDGIEIQGFAVRINPDGSMQCSSSGSTRTSAGSGNNSTHKLLGNNKTTKGNAGVRSEQGKEIEELIRKERIEKEKYEKRMEKIRNERDAYLESLNKDDDVFKQYQSTNPIQPTTYFKANI